MSEENDEEIRGKLKRHRKCPDPEPQKCVTAQLAKISGTDIVVCFHCLSVIPKKTKVGNVVKVVFFSEDMLCPTSR